MTFKETPEVYALNREIRVAQATLDEINADIEECMLSGRPVGMELRKARHEADTLLTKLLDKHPRFRTTPSKKDAVGSAGRRGA